MRSLRFGVTIASTLAVGLLLGGPAAAAAGRTGSPVKNVDVSQRHTNESEEAVAVNPTNPANVVVVSNVDSPDAGMFAGVSFDGGATWATRLIADGDNLGFACCDPTLSFDRFGNLFLSYLLNTGSAVPVALSTDGGLSFNPIASIADPDTTQPAGERRGLFRFVDQPTITAAEGAVWIVFNAGGPIVATGAPVTGLGRVGSFLPASVVPGTNNCTYGDVAIGPGGAVMSVCTLTETGQGGGKLFVNLDPDGLGPAGFGDRVFVTDTHVGGFDFVPPQPDRSVDAEPGLAWDRTGGPHNGRVYLVYTVEHPNESGDMDIAMRHSDDGGATWSGPTRVNDDSTTNTQFLPKIALDQTSGNLAVVWYDARQDLGLAGAGDTDGVPDDDAQFWAAFSADGERFSPNLQVSAGTSNARDAANGIDFGDYTGLSFSDGVAHPAWADNSNSTGTNPDGTLHQLDVYTAALRPPDTMR